MKSPEISEMIDLIALGIAFLSVCVSFYAVRQSRKTALTGTYFSEMAQAYSDYLRCVSEFAFRRGLAERDALAAALYRLQLFASPKIAVDAQKLYVSLLQWASTNPTGALSVDELTNSLGSEMREHLEKVRKLGCP